MKTKLSCFSILLIIEIIIFFVWCHRTELYFLYRSWWTASLRSFEFFYNFPGNEPTKIQSKTVGRNARPRIIGNNRKLRSKTRLWRAQSNMWKSQLNLFMWFMNSIDTCCGSHTLENRKNIPYFISLDSLMLLRFFDMRQTILNIYLVAEKVI